MEVRERKLYILFSIASVAGYSWLAFSLMYNRKHTGVCIFKTVTGIPCPSCGSTRSVISLLNGDLLPALLYNPFGYIIIAVMIVMPVLLIYDMLFRKKVLYRLYLKSENILRYKAVAIPLIALVILNWIWNIIKQA